MSYFGIWCRRLVNIIILVAPSDKLLFWLYRVTNYNFGCTEWQIIILVAPSDKLLFWLYRVTNYYFGCTEWQIIILVAPSDKLLFWLYRVTNYYFGSTEWQIIILVVPSDKLRDSFQRLPKRPVTTCAFKCNRKMATMAPLNTSM